MRRDIITALRSFEQTIRVNIHDRPVVRPGYEESMNRSMTVLALALLTISTSSCTSRNHAPITQDDLVRNTQEMFDAVTAGDQAPWRKYFADDSMYFDEKGRRMDKEALVKDAVLCPRAIPAAS